MINQLKQLVSLLTIVSAMVFVTALPASAHATAVTSSCSSVVLKVGMRDACVRTAQDMLSKNDFMSRRNVTGYFGSITRTAVQAYQARNGIPTTGNIGPLTWKSLLSGSTQSTKLDPRCLKEKKTLCISKKDRTVHYVVNGTSQLRLDARFGDARGPGFKTCEGSFRVSWKSRDHKSRTYNNAPMPFALFFCGGQAVHYSPEFARDGYRGASHGCVNTRDRDRMAWLFDQVPVGTLVVVS